MRSVYCETLINSISQNVGGGSCTGKTLETAYPVFSEEGPVCMICLFDVASVAS